MLGLYNRATTGIVIAANQSSKNRTEEMKETIDKAGENIETNIRTVIVSLTKIQYLLLPYDQNTTHLLNVTTHRLGKGSRLIQSFLHHNGRSIDLAINISYDQTTTHLFVLFCFLIFSDCSALFFSQIYISSYDCIDQLVRSASSLW